MLARAEAEERQMRRNSIVQIAKDALKQKEAYWLGGGGVNEPTPGKAKWPIASPVSAIFLVSIRDPKYPPTPPTKIATIKLLTNCGSFMLMFINFNLVPIKFLHNAGSVHFFRGSVTNHFFI